MELKTAPSPFTQETFDRMISEKIRLIRTEADLTQDKMAEMIGISKKTLVQTEKGRKTLGFTVAALVAVLFRNSEMVQSLFGDSVLEVIDYVAQRPQAKTRYKTLGGKVWWTVEETGTAYIIQKHVLTGHYRILDREHYLQYYSLYQQEALKRFRELEAQSVSSLQDHSKGF